VYDRRTPRRRRNQPVQRIRRPTASLPIPAWVADLAAAITVLDRGRREQSLAGRMLALHPHPDARARALRRGSDTRAA